MDMKKILLPFDGSDHSIDACQYALMLAKMSGAEVTIINCYELLGDMHSAEIGEKLFEDILVGIKKRAEQLLKEAEKLFLDQGVSYKLDAIAGAPGLILTELAKSKEFDLIVMGSHGHSDIAGLFLGNVTHRVLNTIYCPVMIVP